MQLDQAHCGYVTGGIIHPLHAYIYFAFLVHELINVIFYYIKEVRKFIYLLGTTGYDHTLQDFVHDSISIKSHLHIMIHVASWGSRHFIDAFDRPGAVTFRMAFNILDVNTLRAYYKVWENIRTMHEALISSGKEVMDRYSGITDGFSDEQRERYQSLFIHEPWRHLYNVVSYQRLSVSNSKKKQIGPNWISPMVSSTESSDV